jgi:hypothetical protein
MTPALWQMLFVLKIVADDINMLFNILFNQNLENCPENITLPIITKGLAYESSLPLYVCAFLY